MTQADLPPVFDAVNEHLRVGSGHVKPLGQWLLWKDRCYSLTLNVSVTEGSGFPAQSVWHLVVSGDQSPTLIKVYPDRERGPAMTFPHQNAVDDRNAGVPWVSGDPCLGAPRDIWGKRLGEGEEPTQLSDRLVWHVQRFEKWCIAASKGQLHMTGDHFEMPALPGGPGATRIAFSESIHNIYEWSKVSEKYGQAELVEVSSQKRSLAVRSWRSARGDALIEPEWGEKIRAAKHEPIPCA